jgi:hypothetical protein
MHEMRFSRTGLKAKIIKNQAESFKNKVSVNLLPEQIGIKPYNKRNLIMLNLLCIVPKTRRSYRIQPGQGRSHRYKVCAPKPG